MRPPARPRRGDDIPRNDGRQRCSRRFPGDAQTALQRTRLRELLNEAVDPNRDLEPWETRSLLSEMWPARRRLLEPRVEEADARYRALLAAVEDSQR